jgi:NADH oxidase (H2O2-forming)
MLRKIVIIGGGTAGASAAFAARKSDRSAEITVIDKDNYSTYSRCGLPFAIKGEIQPIEGLIVFPSKVFAVQKIIQKLQTEVIQINHQAREMAYRNMVTDETGKISYDTLIFATGATSSKPRIKGIDNDNVFVLRTIDDGKRIIQFAKSVITATALRGRSVAIIGASFIGLEVAEALKHLGFETAVIARRYLLRPMLDKEISGFIKQRLSNEGIKLVEDKPVSDLSEVVGDIVIVTVGINPQTKLAREIGVQIGTTGGIRTDQYLRTNLPDVYAAGDCAEGISGITAEAMVSGLGTIAARQGMVAGANATGKSETAPLIFNASILRLFDMEIGSVGLTEDYIANNKNLGITSVSSLIKYPSLPHYYPGASDVHIKLIADKETRRIIGGQVLCKSGAELRVNMLSLAIQNKMTITDLQKSDFCYSPPVCDIWEPIVIAAQSLSARLSHR